MMTKASFDPDRGERIRYLREVVLDITQDQFAALLNPTPTRGAVGNWERGGGIKAEMMNAIATRFGVSFDWIANGRGRRPEPGDLDKNRIYIPADEPDALSPAADLAYSRENYRPRLEGAIPELDVALGAGDGNVGEVIALQIGQDAYSGHRVVTEWLFPDTFIENEVRASKRNTLILPVIGDSMFPSYSNGDRVLVDQNQAIFADDAVYAISDGSSPPRIKRLHRVFGSRPVQVRIISDNQIYPIETRELSEVQIIGRVCGIIARR